MGGMESPHHLLIAGPKVATLDPFFFTTETSKAI